MRLLSAILMMGSLLGVVFSGDTLAGTWRLALADTVLVDGGPVRLGDLAEGPVPAAAADLVVHAGGRPNTVVSLSRQGILRRLVHAGLASGVRFSGSEISHLVFSGQNIRNGEIEDAFRRAVQGRIPGSEQGAPATWIELDLPPLQLASDGDWNIEIEDTAMLVAGRNLVACVLSSGDRFDRFQVGVLVHRYGEIATAIGPLDRNTPLHSGLFTWDWRDLADNPSGLSVGREVMSGMSLTHNLKAGVQLRISDLTRTPVIMAGDVVDLLVRRGQVVVTVRAHARQAGCLGQTIPVRNEITGRLVNARVAGPGLVEWRR